MQDVRDPAVAVALDAEHRVDHLAHREPAGVELGRDRVDQERRVGRVRLEHGARQRIAVRLQRRVERAHGERRGAAPVGEVEHADDLAEQLLGREPGEGVGGHPVEVRLGEGAKERCPGPRPLDDARVELADDGTLRGAHIERLFDRAPPVVGPGAAGQCGTGAAVATTWITGRP